MTVELQLPPASQSNEIHAANTKPFLATYILPIKRTIACDCEGVADYLHFLDRRLELIVVDGSASPVFAANELEWSGIRHLPPDPKFKTTNGKVWGVLTGIAAASHERLIIADDDVR